MKKLLLGFGVLLLLLALVVIFLPFLIDLNAYQAQYLPLIEEALNRKVALQDIRLTLIPRIGVSLAGFTVMDDPAFSQGPFASLSSLDVGVKLRPLLNKRVEVEEIALRDPVLTVIKNRQGVLNTSTLGKTVSPKAGAPRAPPSGEGPLRALALLAVERVSVAGGTVTYRDQSAAEPKDYVLQNLEVVLKSLGLGQTPTLHLATVVQPFNSPVQVDGTFGPLQETADIKDADFTIGLGKAAIRIKGHVVGGHIVLAITSPVIKTTDLPVAFPLRNPIQIKDLRIQADAHYPFRDGASLQESVNIPSLALAIVMGQSAVQVNGSAVGGHVKLAATSPSINTGDLPVAVSLKKPIEAQNVRMEVEIEGTQARLHDLSLTLFGGQVKATGALTMGARPAPFESNVSLQGIQLGLVMDAVGPGKISISGMAQAQLAVRGQGYSMPELTRALEGSGRLVIHDGRLEGVNLLKEAKGLLKVVGITPDQANATIFSLIEANARVKRGVLTVERAWMDSRDLQVTAAGTIGFDQTLNLRANVSLSEALSRSLGGPVPVGRLVLTKGRLSVPLVVTGTVQAPSVALDAQAVETKVEKQVTEAMGGLLKGGGQTSEQFLKKGSESLKKLFGQ